MFPNNPSFMDKMVQTKQDEMLREYRSFNEPQDWNSKVPRNRQGARLKMLRVVSLLAALAGLLSLFG